jgi:hypothetical protein
MSTISPYLPTWTSLVAATVVAVSDATAAAAAFPPRSSDV